MLPRESRNQALAAPRMPLPLYTLLIIMPSARQLEAQQEPATGNPILPRHCRRPKPTGSGYATLNGADAKLRWSSSDPLLPTAHLLRDRARAISAWLRFWAAGFFQNPEEHCLSCVPGGTLWSERLLAAQCLG